MTEPFIVHVPERRKDTNAPYKYLLLQETGFKILQEGSTFAIMREGVEPTEGITVLSMPVILHVSRASTIVGVG